MGLTHRLPRLSLVYPPVSEACAPMRDLGLSPPLHLLALAAAVDADVKIHDGTHDSLETILQQIATFSPDVIGMNVDITNYATAVRIANATTSRIILGGNYAAFLAQQILANQPRIEAVCFNDGEEALAGFLRGDLDAANLIHRGGRNPVRLLDISRHPTPAYDLVDMGAYFAKQQEVFGKGFRMMQFYGQKGCVNLPHCTFCGRYDDGMRLRDPAIYAAEVKRYVDTFRLTEVWDRSDSYLQSKRWFAAVHAQLRGLPVTFKTYARADQLTDENIRMLQELHFRMVYIGYEAGDDSLLDGMHKHESTAQYLDVTERVLQAGIDIDASFIIGLPGENKRTLENQVRFVERLGRLGLKKIKVNRVLVLPGTPLYARVCAAFPDVKTLDSLDVGAMQQQLYATYDLSDFGTVDSFICEIDAAADAMARVIVENDGCAEGYGYAPGKNKLHGRER